jgi:hypothetical protein
MPVGRLPLNNVYVYGPVPPLDVIVWPYAVATVPAVNDVGDKLIVGQVWTVI